MGTSNKPLIKKVYRLRDHVYLRPWEDRGDTPDYKAWALGRLSWCIYVNRKPYSHIRRYWNQTLDHRIIALLAINARFENLPDFATSACNRDQLLNVVTTAMVQKLCSGGKDTLLKIVKIGLESGDLCQVAPPPGYRGLCFTGGKKFMEAFAINQEMDAEGINSLSQD